MVQLSGSSRGECRHKPANPVRELWFRFRARSTDQLSVESRTLCRLVRKTDLTPRRSCSPISCFVISKLYSLCNLCVLCVSVVILLGIINHRDTENTEV